MAPKEFLCGKRSKVWSWVQIGYVRPMSDGSDSLQIGQKCNIISVSTSTHFITRLVSLEFCEGYMKDKKWFLKSFLKSLVRISNHPCKNWRSQNRVFSTTTSIWTKKSCHACSLASMKRPKITDTTDTRRRTWIFWTFATQKPLRGNYRSPSPYRWAPNRDIRCIKIVIIFYRVLCVVSRCF